MLHGRRECEEEMIVCALSRAVDNAYIGIEVKDSLDMDHQDTLGPCTTKCVYAVWGMADKSERKRADTVSTSTYFIYIVFTTGYQAAPADAVALLRCRGIASH